VPTIGGLTLAGAPAFKKAPGGAPANVACGIAKLGSTAAFLGKVKKKNAPQLPISIYLWFSSLELIHWVFKSWNNFSIQTEMCGSNITNYL
jgi:hypothetical protein